MALYSLFMSECQWSVDESWFSSQAAMALIALAPPLHLRGVLVCLHLGLIPEAENMPQQQAQGHLN